ncbi:PAS domain S-box protein, partial [Massilia sp.]|uniref:PAS domain S-box protein n=2 Tax=unclassified Massilia TaxID=2609279 RepID=UPI0028A7683A
MSSQPALVADALRLLGAPACACDGAGVIIAANEALDLLLGASPLGRNLPELFVDAAAQTAEGQLAQALHLDCNWHGVLGTARGKVQVLVRSQPLAQGGASIVFADVSAYEQGRETLRTTVLEQRVLIENAPVGILFTQGGQMRSCNPRLAAMAGYSPEELARVAPVDMFESPEAFVRFMDGAFGTIAQGEVFEKAGQRFRRRDGSLFWCRVRAHLVEPGRREAGTIWIVEDVTEARRAQLEVEALLTNSALAIIFTRHRGITRCNGGFREMFGYRGDTPLPHHVRQLYRTDAVCDAVGEAALVQFAGGRSYTTEVEMVRADGVPLWVQLIGFMVNPEEPAHGHAWIIEDRTRHKRSEESLRDALLENQAILDSAVLGIAVVENGHTLHCNRKMEALFGCGAGGISGVSVRSLYPDSDGWQAARAETARDFAAGRVHVSEHRLMRRDGEVFWARLSGRPFDLENPGGRSVWMVDDVTAQREAAEEVRRARDELEVRVAERTAELAGANALLQDEILERRQAEARVHHMAYHDSLTGLPNRALLADRMEQAILAAGRSHTKLAVMFIDLDRFKNINDSLGHLTGDY